MTDETMPTLDEIEFVRSLPMNTVGFDLLADRLLRRIVIVLEHNVVVPKDVVDDAIGYLRIAAEYGKGFNGAPLVKVANMLAAVNKENGND